MKLHTNNKKIDMKRNIIGIVVLAFFIASCGSGKKDKDGALNDKKAELVKLKEEQKALNAKIAKLEDEIAKLEIRAEVDGTVATPRPEYMKRQRLEAGDEFIRLVDTTGLGAELRVPEKEIEDVGPGLVIWMKAHALPQQDFQGRVDKIAPVVQVVDGQRIIVVRSALVEKSDLLKPDMTGTALIYAGKRPIISIATRRVRRWIKTEFLPLLP